MFIRNLLLISAVCASLNMTAAAQPNEQQQKPANSSKIENLALAGWVSGIMSATVGKFSWDLNKFLNDTQVSKVSSDVQTRLSTVPVIAAFSPLPLNSPRWKTLKDYTQDLKAVSAAFSKINTSVKIGAAIAAVTGIASITAFYYAYKAYRAKKAAPQPVGN